MADAHGPRAIGFYFGSGLGMDAAGFRMGEAFYNALGAEAGAPLPKFSPLTIDGAAKVLVELPGRRLSGAQRQDRLRCDVDMLIYVGVNPVVSHGHNTGMFNPVGLDPRRHRAERGEIWTIDPLTDRDGEVLDPPYRSLIRARTTRSSAWLVREVLDGGPIVLAQPVAGDRGAARRARRVRPRDRRAKIAGVSEQDLAELLDAIRRKGGVTVEDRHRPVTMTSHRERDTVAGDGSSTILTGQDEPARRRVVSPRLHPAIR